MKRSVRSRSLSIAAGAFLAAALLAVALAHTPPARERVLAALAAQVAERGYVVRADGIQYNLLTLSLRLSNVTVATPTSPSTPFFSAKEISAALPWRVLTGPFQLDRVELVSPRLTLRRDANGRDNWTVARPQASSEPIGLRLAYVSVGDLVVDWTDEQASAHVDAALSLEMSPKGNAAAGPLRITRPAHVRWRDRSVEISALDAGLAWNDRDLAVDALSLRAGGLALRLSG